MEFRPKIIVNIIKSETGPHLMVFYPFYGLNRKLKTAMVWSVSKKRWAH